MLLKRREEGMCSAEVYPMNLFPNPEIVRPGYLLTGGCLLGALPRWCGYEHEICIAIWAIDAHGKHGLIDIYLIDKFISQGFVPYPRQKIHPGYHR